MKLELSTTELLEVRKLSLTLALGQTAPGSALIATVVAQARAYEVYMVGVDDDEILEDDA